MHTARQMVDTPRLWLMRWPRNAISLLVRAGGLKDDEACKLLRALQVTAVKYGLGLSSQPKVRRGVKEATDARAALRKRWIVVVERLGPGYRTKRGAEVPGWVAVARLPSYKVRRILHRWSVEVPRAIMPNRQRTMHSFHTASGARVSAAPAPLSARAITPAATAPGRSHADGPGRTSDDVTAQHARASEVTWKWSVISLLLVFRAGLADPVHLSSTGRDMISHPVHGLGARVVRGTAIVGDHISTRLIFRSSPD